MHNDLGFDIIKKEGDYLKIIDKKDYSSSITLPKKSILIKGEFSKRENYFIDKMQEGSRYKEAIKYNKNNKKHINMSQIPSIISKRVSPTLMINLVLKDVVLRYAILNGDTVNHHIQFFVNNDRMTMQVKNENQEEQNKNATKKKSIFPSNTIFKKNDVYWEQKQKLDKCIQNEILELVNLGVLINYTQNYGTTLRKDFSIQMLDKFYDLYQKKKVSSSYRPVPWCTTCQKSVHRRDLKYAKSKVENVYVLYEINTYNDFLHAYQKERIPIYLVAATLRPWTVFTSDKLAIAQDTKYAIVEVDTTQSKTRYIIASELLEFVMTEAFFLKYRVLDTIDAIDLQKITLKNPIREEKIVELMIAKRQYIMLDSKNETGIRILSHGTTYLDYLILKQANLSNTLRSFIDKEGKLNNFVPEFQGMSYRQMDKEIVSLLQKKQRLFLDDYITISIKRCKTCNAEIIYRPLNKWYIQKDMMTDESCKQSVENIIQKLKISKTTNVPNITYSLKKIVSKKELAISNERKNGVPVPAFYCADCGNEILNKKVLNICKEIIEKKGIQEWYRMTPDEILDHQIVCNRCQGDFFFKDDNCLNDAFKLMSIPMFPDFKKLEDGWKQENVCIESEDTFLQKMRVDFFDENALQKWNEIDRISLHQKEKETKKKDNILDSIFKPELEKDDDFIKSTLGVKDIVKKYGIDVLRLWAIFRSDKETVQLSDGDLINIKNHYIEIRKTIKYLISNLYDFNPKKDGIPIDNRDDIDCYIYKKLQILETKLEQCYEVLDFTTLCIKIFEFCKMLCENYFESIKFKLYMTGKESKERRSTQSNFYDIFFTLYIFLAPILPLLFEECWPYIYHESVDEEKNSLLVRKKKKLNVTTLTEGQKRWKKIFVLRKMCLPALAQAIKESKIKNALEATIIIVAFEQDVDFIRKNHDDIKRALNVSNLRVEIGKEFQVKVEKAEGVACARCKNYTKELGLNIRYRYLCPVCAAIENKIAGIEEEFTVNSNAQGIEDDIKLGYEEDLSKEEKEYMEKQKQERETFQSVARMSDEIDWDEVARKREEEQKIMKEKEEEARRAEEERKRIEEEEKKRQEEIKKAKQEEKKVKEELYKKQQESVVITFDDNARLPGTFDLAKAKERIKQKKEIADTKEKEDKKIEVQENIVKEEKREESEKKQQEEAKNWQYLKEEQEKELQAHHLEKMKQELEDSTRLHGNLNLNEIKQKLEENKKIAMEIEEKKEEESKKEEQNKKQEEITSQEVFTKKEEIAEKLPEKKSDDISLNDKKEIVEEIIEEKLIPQEKPIYKEENSDTESSEETEGKLGMFEDSFRD